MSHAERCTCRECRLGDALPERLQGIPGTFQFRLFGAAERAPAEVQANAAPLVKKHRADRAKVKRRRHKGRAQRKAD